jgi:hypothetical protein
MAWMTSPYVKGRMFSFCSSAASDGPTCGRGRGARHGQHHSAASFTCGPKDIGHKVDGVAAYILKGTLKRSGLR